MNDLILFLLLILLIAICSAYLAFNQTQENFETYFYDPYGYGSTGADPLTFYKYPIYRKPYRYPFKYYSSFPYPYLTYHKTNI